MLFTTTTAPARRTAATHSSAGLSSVAMPMPGASRLSSQSVSDSRVALRFIGWAALAVIADLGTKYWAVSSLGERTIVLSDWFSMMLVFNTGVAGGASIGPHTWLINVIGTLATVLLVISVVLPLARVDGRAAIAMGLIAGGASGNLASIIGEPRGVPDFLAQQVGDSIIVYNVADVALWIGAAILIPITVGLVTVIKKDRQMNSQGIR